MEGRNESSIYQRRVRPSQEEEICYFGSSVGKSVYEVQCPEKRKKDQNKLFQALQVDGHLSNMGHYIAYNNCYHF